MRRPAVGSCAALTAFVLGLAVPAVAAPALSAQDTAGTVFSDGFTDLTHWTKTQTPAGGTDWTATGGTATVDTSTASSGSYLRPSDALTLPGSYELTTRVKIDKIASDGNVSFVLDMQDKDNPTTKDIATQITGVKSTGRAGVQAAVPLSASPLCSGDSPVTTGDWLDVRVVRAGGVTATFLGGRLVTAEKSPTAGGTFAFGSYHSKISVAPVTVSSLSGTPADQPTSATGCTYQAPDQNTPGHQVIKGDATQSLNGSWSFTTGADNNYEDPATGTSGWDTMQVPGNWDTKDDYAKYQGVGWYRRDFTVAHPGGTDSRYWLDIDACFNKCQVWVNGKPIKSLVLTDNSAAMQDGTDLSWAATADTHLGGYTPFQLDVTDAVKTSGTNTVVIKADNSQSVGALWPWGGLSRDVSLTTTEALSVTRQEITTAPDLTAGTATVTSKVFVRNTGSTDTKVTVTGNLTSGATGADVPGGTGLTGTATIKAGQTAPVTVKTTLAKDTYSLWQLDDPNLYRLGVTVATDTDPDTALHGISDAFGIRSVTKSGTKMFLNGRQIKMAGANRVSDDPVNGNTEPVDQVHKDLDMMKSAGMNAMRIMHYAQSPELLDYADRIGMLLITETPEWGVDANQLKDLPNVKQQMLEQVQADYNHPSIFAWSVANELADNTADGETYSERMSAFSKHVDPSRFVTQVSYLIDDKPADEATGEPKNGWESMDFISMNHYDNTTFATGVENVHSKYPDKPIFVSEFNADQKGCCTIAQSSTDFKGSSSSATREFADKDYVFGWSQWTYGDYRSSFTGSSPNNVRTFGAVDVWDRPKAAYGATQAANAPVTSLALSGRYTQGGKDAATATVTPRGALTTDGPSWKLSGYQLALRVTDAGGTVVGGSLTDLPEIDPGDTALKLPVSWNHSDSAVSARLSLLSPQGFQVAIATMDLKAPAKPTITGTSTANGSVRVRYSDTADGLTHTVKATTAGGTVAATKTTTEPYADLSGLTNGTEYTVSVTTDNSAGSSDPATAKLTPGGTLPAGPNIVTVVPVDKGLMLGYSDSTAGATFEVTVTDTASNTQVQDYKTTARPGTLIENLTPGHTYSLRIERLAGDGKTAASAWSETVQGTVPGTGAGPALKVTGTIGGTTTGAIAVDPAPGTVRYQLTVNNGTPYYVDRSAIDLIPVSYLKARTSNSVTLKAIGTEGSSQTWSGTITTIQASPTDAKVTGAAGDRTLSWTAPSPAPDSYTVTRTACGTSTTTKVTGTTQLALGGNGGSYTVTATTGTTASGPTAPLGVGGGTDCGAIVSTTDTTARADGSKPFTTTGTWSSSALTTPDGYPSVYATPGTPTATWTAPRPTTATTYKVEVALPGGASATSVTYTLTTADGKKTKTVDQNAAGTGWTDLGTYSFAAGQTPILTITSSSGGNLRASAARFTATG
ncbi:glycoside hydrolase family 2 TIM barrel-domain containing protein [Streptomyces sp. NPDC048409]|uniref:glycoside hydrolase family 2 TIM barrel-domain containing protein n=1 Tax=Streptomyces sp. NPDC048409 TaxID=3154723 RepID=UPI0034475B76